MYHCVHVKLPSNYIVKKWKIENNCSNKRFDTKHLEQRNLLMYLLVETFYSSHFLYIVKNNFTFKIKNGYNNRKLSCINIPTMHRKHAA